VIARLLEHPHRYFADQAVWNAHLDALGISALKVTPDPVLIATEGALWGSIKAHGFLPNTVIVSDDAGQFTLIAAQHKGRHGVAHSIAERQCLRDRTWGVNAADHPAEFRAQIAA
jgi:hypothetical protein